MKKRIVQKKNYHLRRVSIGNQKRQTIKEKHFLSFLKGGGEIYVIFILATLMAGALALTGGALPKLDDTQNEQQVQIDESSASRSSEQSLQLANINPKPTSTPTLPPTTPTVTPTPPVSCLDKTVLTLVLDVSTSMNADGKIGQLNAALRNLVGSPQQQGQVKDDTVIGAVEFAGLASFKQTNGADTVLPFTRYKDNKQLIQSKLDNLSVLTDSPNDGTYFRSGFSKAISNINAAKNEYESQGYKFVSVVFTDGVPETQYTDHDCLIEVNDPYVCFANKQDPRTDLTRSLKGVSSKVYSIGIYSGQRERAVLTQAKQLLADIASKPSYTTNSSDPTAIKSMFQSILTSVCN